jgi:hypothetical protein
MFNDGCECRIDNPFRILPYHLRLKGLGILLSVQNVAQAFNQWVNPVALESIGWKYYIVYIVLQCVYLALIVLFFPETRRLSIEEVSVIFDTGRKGDAAAATAEFMDSNKDVPGAQKGSVDKQGATTLEKA